MQRPFGKSKYFAVAIAISLTVAPVGVANASSPSRSNMIDLGTLGGTNSRASAASGSIVVGDAELGLGDDAFAYDLSASSPQIKDLGSLATTYHNGPQSSAHGISGNIVVGTSFADSARFRDHAFAHNLSSGGMVDLGTLGGTSSSASSVSGTIVVGTSTLPGDTVSHAFADDLSTPSPHMVDLGTLGGTSSSASGVSGTIVVGTSTLPGDTVSHAFAYDLSEPSPHMIDLGTLGGSSWPSGVSGNIVVGNSTLPGDDTATHAFAYDLSESSPHMVDLGTLGGTSSSASGVSGTIVVGNSTLASGTATHAFVYDLSESSPHMVDLGTLGGTSSSASGVSGTIVVGNSTLASGTATHAFVYDLSESSPHILDLGTLGGTSSSASGVSGSIIFGVSTLRGDTAAHAFAYDLSAPSHPRITSVSPNPFSPNHDGRDDTTSFRIHVSVPEAVTLRIDNGNGKTVQGPHSPGLIAAGDHTYQWDGKTNASSIASDGAYTVVVMASAKIDGMTFHATTATTVRLDNTPSTLSRITGNGSTFYPFCGPCGTRFGPKVTVNESGGLWLEIDTVSGSKVKVIAQPHASTGTFRLTWNGHNLAGHVAAEGTYRYHFIAQDAAGNRRTSANYIVHLSYKRLR